MHLLKLHRTPGDQAANHWRGELVGFLADAQARFAPSMRHRLDLDALWRRAVRQVEVEGGTSDLLPTTCPFGADDLLAEASDLPTLLAMLEDDRVRPKPDMP